MLNIIFRPNRCTGSCHVKNNLNLNFLMHGDFDHD